MRASPSPCAGAGTIVLTDADAVRWLYRKIGAGIQQCVWLDITGKLRYSVLFLSLVNQVVAVHQYADRIEIVHDNAVAAC